MGRRLDGTGAAEFLRTLAHRREAHARAALGWQPHAVLGYLQYQLRSTGSTFKREANLTEARLGVTRRVCKGFPGEVVGSNLDGRGQRRQFLGRIDGYPQPRFAVRRVLLRIVADGKHEAELIEGRGRRS